MAIKEDWKKMHGQHLRLIIYTIKKAAKTTLVTGYSIHLREEFTVLLDSSQNVRLGNLMEFTVFKQSENGLIPVDGTLKEFKPDPDYSIQHNVVLMSTIVIFDPDNQSECWSDDFGWIYVPAEVHQRMAITAEVPYRAHIKRDNTRAVCERELLFSAVYNSHLTDMNTPKKQSCIDEYRQAKKVREAKRKIGKWSQQLEKAGPSKEWETILSREEQRQQEKKKLADSVSLFMILDLKGDGNLKGSAWAMKLRKIGLNTDVINATSTPLEPGVWYEGVVKWIKRMDKNAYSGYAVDKVWRRTEIPPFKTKAVPGKVGQVEMELDVNFGDWGKVVQVNKDKRILPSSKIEVVDVPSSIYNQHQNCLVTCRLVNRQDKVLNTDDKADWVVSSILKVKGQSEEEISAWCTSGQAPAEVGQNTDIYEDDDEEIPNYDEGMSDMEDDAIPVQISQISQPIPQKMTGSLPSGSNLPRPEPIYTQPNPQSTMNRSSTFGAGTKGHFGNSSVKRELIHDYMVYDKIENVSISLVVETTNQGSLIYAPSYETIFTYDKLRPGDWVTVKMSELVNPQGSIKYLATSTQPVDFEYAPEKRIIGGNRVQLKLDVDILAKKSLPDGFYSLPNNMLREVFSPEYLLIEGSGDTVRVSNLQPGYYQKFNFWAEYKENAAFFRWELVSVCLPSERPKGSIENNSNNQSPHLLSHDSRSFLPQYSSNSAPRFLSSQNQSFPSQNSSHQLLAQLWDLSEVRKITKAENFILYEKVEDLVSEMKARRVSADQANSDQNRRSSSLSGNASTSYQNGPNRLSPSYRC